MTSRRDGRQKPIFVAGSGRSGTTWISSVLGECHDAISVFEPLNRRRVPGVPLPARFPASPGTYLRATSSNAAWNNFFQQLFDGSVTNSWTRQDWKRMMRAMEHVPLGERISYHVARRLYEKRDKLARFRIIKSIRANLLLDWLIQHFGVRVVFVIRHPCAVVASRLRHGWPTSLSGIFDQPTLVADHLQPMRDWIRRADTDLDRMTILWCVENLVPLAARRPRHMTLHRYELFARAPQREFSHLFDCLQLRPTASAEHAMARYHSNESAAARRHCRIWHAGLGPRRGRRVLDICRAFGLQMYGTRWDPVDEAVPSPVNRLEPAGSFGSSCPSRGRAIEKLSEAGLGKRGRIS